MTVKTPVLIRKKIPLYYVHYRVQFNYGETASRQKSKLMYKNYNSTRILA